MNLDNIKALVRIQNPKLSDWATLRYDDVGSCEVLAQYEWKSASNPLSFGGGLLVCHNGVVKNAYLSFSNDTDYVAVISDSFPALPEWARETVLDLAEGKKKTVKTIVVKRLAHPTDSDKVAIGLV